jgi:hypothetical protein
MEFLIGGKRMRRESNTVGVLRILDLVVGDVDRGFEGASL